MTLRPTDYALLAQDSYHDRELFQSFKLDGVEYRAIDHMDNPKNGFQATAYENRQTHEVVIAYRGTEFDREPKQDGLVDAGMALKGVNAQTADSETFTQRVIAEAKKNSEKSNYPLNVTVTGHSLGGTLAEINAYKFGLHGETFNAFGAAGLVQGVPAGGDQVIDNVRATDIVSAASPHFGQVRMFAVPQDTQALSDAGYSDSRLVDALMPHAPVLGKIQGDAHAIDNFVPQSKLLGHSIITTQNQVYAQEHEHMIGPYRNDVMMARMTAFVGYQTQRPMIEGATIAGEATVHTGQYVSRETVHAYEMGKEKAIEGLHATEHAAQYVGHEAVKGYNATVDATSRGIEATVEGAKAVGHFGERVYDATVDAAYRGMEDITNFAKAHPIQLNHPLHPDNKLFQQAHDGVKKIDAEHGRVSDHYSQNLAGALTVEAKAQGLKRIDMVALSDDGSKAFAAHNIIPGAFKNVAGVETAKAVHIPIEQNTQQMAQVNRALQQQVQSQQQVQQQAASVNSQQANPTMMR